jgi:hypothetical protein
METDDGAWFAPKRFGYGAGLPIRWQGWAVLGAYLVALTGLQSVLRNRHPAVLIATAIILTALLLVICARHARGGWRWRWGGD